MGQKYYTLKSFLSSIMLIYLINLLINFLNHNVSHCDEVLGQMKTLQQTEEITFFVLFLHGH